MPSTWAEQAWAVCRKDLLIEVRSRTNLNAMMFFAGMVMLVFSFALGPSPTRLQGAAAGILWLAVIFAGMLAFGHAYQIEMENRAFEGLMLTAQNRSAVYGGKLLSVVVLMLVIEMVVVPLMALLYNLDLWTHVLVLAPVMVLGTIGFASVGTVYGALTMSLRAREVLLPILLLPITVPVLLGAVKATGGILNGGEDGMVLWIELLVAFDVIFVTAGLLVYEYAVGE